MTPDTRQHEDDIPDDISPDEIARDDDDIRAAFIRQRSRRPRRRLVISLSFNRIFPNILTLLALCAGLTAIRFGLAGEWERAILAQIAAALLDGIDGRVARLLRVTSKFGAELDSLADTVSFGVSPAMLMFLWTMDSAGGVGWALCLLFVVCCVLRLARFNTMLGQPDLPPWAHNYFTGVPAPAGGGLAVLPMSLWLATEINFFRNPVLVGVMLFVVAVLMVSRVPTYAGKHIRLKPPQALLLMLAIALTFAFLVTNPWATLSLLGFVYLASIPFSIKSFQRLKAAAAQPAEPVSPASPPAR